ncbi:MAG: NINE protein [Bacteroidales bacterium]|nr:NINE protein [Bacteroidales bacterium]MDD4217483.1 NINE protein [Bacteroidales bacterium]
MENTKNCIKCGAQIPVDAMICPVCGANQMQQTQEAEQQQFTQQPAQQPIQQPNQAQDNLGVSDKEKNTALILCVLAYVIQIHGIHRFYTGHIGIGIIQLLTWGGCGIWTLVDLIQIASGNFKDAEGRLLKA